MDICVLINYFIVLFFRYQYLSNVVLQARSACSTHATVNSMVDHSDNGLLELLEGKLAVLRFQMKIKEELEPFRTVRPLSTSHQPYHLWLAYLSYSNSISLLKIVSLETIKTKSTRGGLGNLI